jgi:hypothetical protein
VPHAGLKVRLPRHLHLLVRPPRPLLLLQHLRGTEGQPGGVSAC